MMNTNEFNIKYPPGTPVIVKSYSEMKTHASLTRNIAVDGKVKLKGYEHPVDLQSIQPL